MPRNQRKFPTSEIFPIFPLKICPKKSHQKKIGKKSPKKTCEKNLEKFCAKKKVKFFDLEKFQKYFSVITQNLKKKRKKERNHRFF